MRTVAVTTPEGASWNVRVVWAPRWRALARRFGGWRAKRSGDAGDLASDALDLGGNVANAGGGGGGGGDGGLSLGDEILAIVVIFFALVLAAVLFWWVLLPLLLLVLDAVIVLVLLAVTIMARVLFRRPWTVEATSAGHERVACPVVGWRAALRQRDEMADSLRRGLRPEGAPAVSAGG
ncbi:hypothetical protein ODJ79_33545 [Actinoplanes sp. KI2]|uniref:hypothetical protein n=1 Tax=Actinoplanes sp. KI2 TaxID=2983315 RepID=UPI0021D58F87|nr:hypothetical protein [Actinoplanes sp. KI2]MCU7728664.1 hypothetical protein [Actinoplanes sp. KI2]